VTQPRAVEILKERVAAFRVVVTEITYCIRQYYLTLTEGKLMTWLQNYIPLGNLGVSALVAAIPCSSCCTCWTSGVPRDTTRPGSVSLRAKQSGEALTKTIGAAS
jgi:hypothetical protein